MLTRSQVIELLNKMQACDESRQAILRNVQFHPAKEVWDFYISLTDAEYLLTYLWALFPSVDKDIVDQMGNTSDNKTFNDLKKKHFPYEKVEKAILEFLADSASSQDRPPSETGPVSTTANTPGPSASPESPSPGSSG